MRLKVCPHCAMHIMVEEITCPHCNESLSRRPTQGFGKRAGIALLLGLGISACGGDDKETGDASTSTNTSMDGGSGLEPAGEPEYGVVETGDPQPDYGVPYYFDEDGDGFEADIDCDDNDPNTFPGAGFNESDTNACMTDADGDGYGSMTPASGNITAGTDCDDSDAAINPGATEATGDDVDSNCNGDNDN